MISPDLLLTAAHVVSADAQRSFLGDLVFHFFHFFHQMDTGEPPRLRASIATRAAAQGVVFASGYRDEDYALVRLDGAPCTAQGESAGRDGFTPVVLAGRAPQVGEPVALIHHPDCKRKKIGLRHDPRVESCSDLTFSHGCRTEQGSSGAPVIAVNDGTVIGIHGGTLTQGPGTADAPTALAPTREATCISRFVADLGARNRALLAEILPHQPRLSRPLVETDPQTVRLLQERGDG